MQGMCHAQHPGALRHGTDARTPRVHRAITGADGKPASGRSGKIIVRQWINVDILQCDEVACCSSP